MSQQRRALVVTGLIRDPHRFGAYLDGIARLGRPDLRLVISTWTGELARYPAIAAQLAALEAEIAEQPQPDLKLPGHMLHQVMALERGLSALADDVFVLRARPDICTIGDVAEFLALAPRPLGPGRLATPFGHRVHVVGLFGAQPLYINDIVFAGMAGDLRRLCWLPFAFGLKYPRLAPEQWLWATALAPGHPVLDAYLSANPGLIFADPAANAALRATLAASKLFARAIAATAILFRDSLAYFHPDPQHAAIVADCAGHTLEALLWDRLGSPGLDHHPTAETNTFVSAGVMDAVHDGLYRPSALGDRVQQAMARYGEPGGAAAMQHDRALLAEEAAALRASLHPRGSAIPAPWSLADTGAGYAATLEADINHLRRTVDQLQAELARRTHAVG